MKQGTAVKGEAAMSDRTCCEEDIYGTFMTEVTAEDFEQLMAE
jgi:hypothetical protein